MAYRGPSYGLTLDCKKKTREKFDVEKAAEALRWVERVTGRGLEADEGQVWSERGFAAALRDGVALCELMNAIQPNAIPRIHKNKAPFQQMENLHLFTTACKKYGMNTLDVFQTADLYEAQAMYTVVNCIYALGSLAQKNGFSGPSLGVKIAVPHKRQFSQEQLAESGKVIGLQYGSNRVASQAGMTPYGLQRQILSSSSSCSSPTEPLSPTDDQPFV